jgi:hypothetical protein
MYALEEEEGKYNKGPNGLECRQEINKYTNNKTKKKKRQENRGKRERDRSEYKIHLWNVCML